MSPTSHSSHIPCLRFSGFFGEWEETRRWKEFTNFPTNSISRDWLNYEEWEIKNIHYWDIHTKFNILFDITKEKVPYINLDIKFNQSNICDKWDIIVADASEDYSDIGKAIEITNIDNQKIVAWLHTLHFRSKDKKFASWFLGYLLKTSSFRRKIQFIAQGAKVLWISVKEFNKIWFIIPEKQEQTKIASFLSAVDDKIASLTDLRTAWADYKTGMMQQIFSQSLRFPGFTEEWEEKQLGEVGDFQTSSIDKLSREDEKEVFLVNYMNVYRHENINNNTIRKYQTVTAKNSQIESCNLKKWDILFTPSSETPDDIGHSIVIFEDLNNAVFSYHLMRFRPKSPIHILYSHYFCNIPAVLKQMSQLATGSTRFTISVRNFANITVKLPSLPEQEKIANFLISIDDKIAELDTQIQTAKQWKTGLLQGLFI